MQDTCRIAQARRFSQMSAKSYSSHQSAENLWCTLFVVEFSMDTDLFTACRKKKNRLKCGFWLQVLTNSCRSNPQSLCFPFPLPVKTHNCVFVLLLWSTTLTPWVSIYFIIIFYITVFLSIIISLRISNDFF